MGELLAFFILALAAIAGGVLMLNLENVMHMVISLVFTFLSLAGIYVMLSAEFVAVVQVLIYSGAITIIMLFGIMLTKHDDRSRYKVSSRRLLLSLFSAAAFFFIMFYGINDLNLGTQAAELHEENTKAIGMMIYSQYVIPFELLSVLLLVALIGAIILAKRDDEESEQK
jgi:NADH-quinone oxidoreductase subunit J